MGRPTCFTPTTDLILKGAKRQARARSGPAKKAPALSPVKLASVLAKIYPIDDLVGMACPVRLRTAFRALFIYHTLCRYSCFSKFQAKHFEPVDNDILVTFPSSKNDQMHRGQQSCLVAIDSPLCPVRDNKTLFLPLWIAHGRSRERLLLHQFPASPRIRMPASHTRFCPELHSRQQ